MRIIFILKWIFFFSSVIHYLLNYMMCYLPSTGPGIRQLPEPVIDSTLWLAGLMIVSDDNGLKLDIVIL